MLTKAVNTVPQHTPCWAERGVSGVLAEHGLQSRGTDDYTLVSDDYRPTLFGQRRHHWPEDPRVEREDIDDRGLELLPRAQQRPYLGS
jgi:hypothetical protein